MAEVDGAAVLAPGRVLFMVTSHLSLGFVSGLAGFLGGRGWDAHVSSAPAPAGAAHRGGGRYVLHSLPMARDISPRDDPAALLRAMRLIRRLRPAIVVAGTPKASLLGLVASFVLRVPRRVYVMHGLRLEGEEGARRAILRALEWITCRCATDVVAVSRSLADRAVSLRLCPPGSIRVLGPGSANGVDTSFFEDTFAHRRAAVPPEFPGRGRRQPTLGYIGRIHPDKGLELLGGSLRLLASRGVRGRLIVVGEDDDPRSSELRAILDASGWQVDHVGFVPDVRAHLQQMDLLCVPSRREGFVSVVIEASAAGVPSVATLATGVPDAVEHGVTGVVVADRTPESYARALCGLLSDDELREQMAVAGRRRVEQDFDCAAIWDLWAHFLAQR